MTLQEMLNADMLCGELRFYNKDRQPLHLCDKDYTDEDMENAKVLYIMPQTFYRLGIVLDL